jgi:Protein of unknown function (DUF2586)
MALPNVTFYRNSTGLGQTLPGKDYISGFVFYSNYYPSGFNVNNKIKKIFSLSDAENLGIDTDYSDEVKATGGNVAITVKGAAGDIDSVFFAGVLLGQVTVPATPYSDASAEATAIRAAINSNTQYHGFTSAGSTSNVTIVPPTGFGKASLGAAKITFTSLTALGAAGTATATVTDLTTSTGSLYSVWHYHISEYFRLNPNGVAYVGVFPVTSYAGTEIQTLQDYAAGEIRQCLVVLGSVAFASGQLTATQVIATALQTAHKPISNIILDADLSGGTISALSDLSTLTCKNLSVCIACDGDFLESSWSATSGYSIGDKVTWGNGCYQAIQKSLNVPVWNTQYWTRTRENTKALAGFSVSGAGTLLGAISYAAVSDCIAWVEKFNLVTNTGFDNIGFVTGDLYKNQTDSLLSTLNDQHYIFMRKIIGVTGTFFNDSWTAITKTNDYCYIEKNRTMDKAERNVYAAIIPKLASPIYVNSDGTLTSDTIAIWKNLCEIPLESMVIAKELSAMSVTIPSTQNVISTSQIQITLQEVPTGVARNIIIYDGFTTKIA